MKTILALAVLLCTMMTAAWTFAAAGADTVHSPSPAMLPLKVVGTNILNSNGETVWLRSVNAASLVVSL